MRVGSPTGWRHGLGSGGSGKADSALAVLASCDRATARRDELRHARSSLPFRRDVLEAPKGADRGIVAVQNLQATRRGAISGHARSWDTLGGRGL